MKIKFLIAASVVALTAASSANAADIIRNEPAPVVVAPVFSWTGAFVGGQIGAKWTDAKTHLDYEEDYSYDKSGFMGGLYAGYNYQFSNNVVLGADTDFTWADVKADYTDREIDGAGTIKEKWAGSTRIRLGYALDRWMPYVAAGVAYAQLNDKYDYFNGDKYNINETYTGYTVGGGVEYALTDNVLLRGEYRYSDFGHKNLEDGDGRFTYKTNDIRVGVAYKF